MQNENSALRKSGAPLQRCIFCRQDSTSSQSIEHVIPFALGNVDHVLPPGVVCDKCNNYFGRKLEHEVLTSPYFLNLRSRRALKTRAGNAVEGGIILSTGGAYFRASFMASHDLVINDMSVDGKTKLEEAMSKDRGGQIWIPHSGAEPDEKCFSRLLAKIGLEMMAHRLAQTSQWEALYSDDVDPIRLWARYGSGSSQWPFHRRRLYEEDRSFEDQAESYQCVHEFDLLRTEKNEIFAVICIFGEEFTINIGGPDTAGYLSWLADHDDVSPLYFGRNTKVTGEQ